MVIFKAFDGQACGVLQ